MADEVSVDSLLELQRIGRVRLPSAAAAYGETAEHVNATQGNEGEAFGGDLGTSPFYGPFVGMRNLFQDRVLVQTQTAIINSGEALAQIALSFAEQDASAASELEAKEREFETGQDADGNQVPEHDLPPEEIPEAPTSGDSATDPENGEATDVRGSLEED